MHLCFGDLCTRGTFLLYVVVWCTRETAPLGIHLSVLRQSHECPEPVAIGESYLTMVCLSTKEDHKSAKNSLPALKISSSEDRRLYEGYCALQTIRKALATKEEKSSCGQGESMEDDVNREELNKVTIADTKTVSNRFYSPGEMNLNNSVFGGHVLRWMEENARYCGRMFTRSPHIYTLGMHDMVFDHPLYGSDCVSLVAKVVYVRHTTLEVDVDLTVERDGKCVKSNRASFVLISMDGSGTRIPISKGLDLEKSSPEDREAYVKARKRYLYGLEAKKKSRKGPSSLKMIRLTEEDITEESIRLEEARLREKARDVEELRSRLAELQEKLREAEEEQACIANSLQWRRMMAEVEGDEEIAGITAAVTAALNEFRATLQPPVDYDEAVENIPYVYTDDYADFTPLESLFDDRLGLVLELVAGAGNRGAESRGRRHRRAMLMLLVLTLSLKQLVDLESEAAGVAKEIEELVENVTAAWQQLLYTDSGLSVAEKSVWKEIAKTFLGEPYDTVA